MQDITSCLKANRVIPIHLRKKTYLWKRVYIRSMVQNNRDSFLKYEIENILNMIETYDDTLTDLALEIIITKFNINV